MESHAQSIQGPNMNEELINDRIVLLKMRVDALQDLVERLVTTCEKLNQRLNNQAEAIRLTKDLVILTTQQSI